MLTQGGSSVLTPHKGGETKRFPLSQTKLAAGVGLYGFPTHGVIRVCIILITCIVRRVVCLSAPGSEEK